ncbi:alkyl sulfatase C-terminal domain-containing protein [Streptomyces sp. RKAG337]|uniref:alkyl sulfatase C-terminal domain-containing protein n=1 Tax=Streptomyces sp. RKAG337 TaxID=2893404 RepID=UPI00203488E0|nr:alkyl sulfatase C-terminal domain-containing protein [Streptomyces sp. RKAG337]MCM2427697.1 MBL fold metallo-hydrolase [Streptomyces sp. RKAG337]
MHPSLWRQSQLINEAGLYEVSERIYQVRNHDLANVTIIEGDGGLIVVDTGSKAECAEFAMDLYYAHRPHLPVVAVICTHTHIDHYGGITGITTPEDVAAGKVAILAPGENFGKYTLGENVICGNVMSRRAAHAFGTLLPHGPQGMVSDGGGLALPPTGTFAYIEPTDTVTTTGETRTLAGLEFVFQMAPDTEAPEEFHFYIPELKALTCAENANHSYEQLGYQSEGPQWRNLYLAAAQELRDGLPTTGVQSTGSIETIMAMPLDLFLDYIAVRLNGPKAAGTTLVINLDLTDGDQPGPHSLHLLNSVLHHRTRHTADPDLTLRLGKAQLAGALLMPGAFTAAADAGRISTEGDRSVFTTLTGLLDDFSPYFALTNSNA